MSEQICILCNFYTPRAETHRPDRTRTCQVGRRRLERDRLAVRAMYLRLIEEQPDLIGAKDAISVLMPMAITPGKSNKPQVTGTREKQLPINVDAFDLTAAAQVGPVHDERGDQTGRLSVATVLNEWVAGWHQQFFSAETCPVPDAVRLLDWLGGIRLELLCEVDPGIADFARELGELRNQLYGALGESEPPPAVMWGVPCPRCNTVSQLKLKLDDPNRYRECDNCGKLLTEAEYKDWLKVRVEQERAKIRGGVAGQEVM